MHIKKKNDQACRLFFLVVLIVIMNLVGAAGHLPRQDHLGNVQQDESDASGRQCRCPWLDVPSQLLHAAVGILPTGDWVAALDWHRL